MSNPKYKWDQPSTPPPPMFFGSKERDLVKQVNDELAERVIGQTVAYYPISIEESNFNEIYGEAIDKVSLPPVRVYAYVEVENVQTTEKFGYEYQTKLVVNFHRRRLTEDQNLYVRVGDFLQYGDQFYEIVRTYNDTRYYFGQVQHKFQISAECVKARRGLFRVMPSVDRPGDDVAEPGEGSATPAPRPAPYPPLDASYIVVSDNTKLPNDRVLASGSNIAITDGGPNSTITIATTSELTASNMRITGDLTMVGTIVGGSPVEVSSSIDIVDSAGTTVATLGSSSLGSSIFSASFGVATNVSASGYISASNFYGDGAGITNLPAAAISSYTNPANNRVITSVDAATVTGEPNLTFDGSTLTVAGDVTSSANVSASAFYGDGSNLSGLSTGGGIFTVIDGSNASVTSSLNIGGTATPDHQVVVSGSLSASTNISASSLYIADSIIRSGDSDTYIQFHSAGDQIDFYVGGERLLKIDEGGTDEVVVGDGGHVNFRAATAGYGYNLYVKSTNAGGVDNAVGIREQSPQAVLHVSGTTEQVFLVEGDAGNILMVSGSGRVGVGTDSPDYTLDVAGDAGFNEYIYHNGDTDTYMRFRGDQIDFVAGGMTFLTLDESAGSSPDTVAVNNGANDIDFQVQGAGEANLIRTDAANDRVGIGVLVPSASLHVSSSGDQALFRVDGATTGSVLFVTGSGKVGIGTTTPGDQYTLDMPVSTSAARLGRVELGSWPVSTDYGYLGHTNLDHTGYNYNLILGANGSLDLNSQGEPLGFRTGGTAALKAAITIDGNFGIGPNAGHVSGFVPSALLQVSSSGDQELFRVDGATSGSVLFVTGSGRVGIGTTSPGKTLTVVGEISASSAIYGTDLVLKTSAADTIASIYIEGTSGTEIIGQSGGNMDIRSDGGSLNLLGGTGGALYLGSDNDTFRAILDTDGKFGIGTVTPSHTLTVIGASHLSGGVVHTRTSVTNNYSVALTDYYLGVDTTANTVQLTIPAASTATAGQTFVVKDEGGNAATNAITLIRSASDTIDGQNIITVDSPYAALSLYTNGTNWFVY